MDNSTLIENLECAIILIDHQRMVQRVNLSAETMFCQSRRYLIGVALHEIIPNPEVEQAVVQCFQNNAQFTLREVAIALVGGDQVLVDMTLSCVLSDSVNTLGTDGGDPMQQVLIEINSINRISGFMQEKNQLERQQSFRLMMRGLAHEIKNPLGGIRGAAQLLDRELEDASQKDLTDILIKEADRLTRLVDRVMGSRQQLKPEPLNIHEVLEHVVHLANARSQGSLVVERFYDPALPELLADQEQLIQVY